MYKRIKYTIVVTFIQGERGRDTSVEQHHAQ